MSYRKQFIHTLLPLNNKRYSRKISKPLLRHRRKSICRLCKNKRRSRMSKQLPYRMRKNRITSRNPYKLNSMIKTAKKQQNKSWKKLRKAQLRNKSLLI